MIDEYDIKTVCSCVKSHFCTREYFIEVSCLPKKGLVGFLSQTEEYIRLYNKISNSLYNKISDSA